MNKHKIIAMIVLSSLSWAQARDIEYSLTINFDNTTLFHDRNNNFLALTESATTVAKEADIPNEIKDHIESVLKFETKHWEPNSLLSSKLNQTIDGKNFQLFINSQSLPLSSSSELSSSDNSLGLLSRIGASIKSFLKKVF